MSRLLILDDDPAIGQTIQFIAEATGVDTRFTARPDQFFEWLDEWRPTHIALDLIMPVMDGVEVLVQLASRNCSAKIIITSGVGPRVLDAAGRSAAEHGLDIVGVLSKPFSAAALRKLLQDPGDGRQSAEMPAADYHRKQDERFEVTVERLRNAIDWGELDVVYQPKVACADGALAGFEALVRWMHPQGVIMPDRFIPFAESNGLIDAVTERVLDLTLDWFSRHFREDTLNLAVNVSAKTASAASMSMNISAKTLKDQEFVEHIVNRCRQKGVDPSRLIFELTETAAMEDAVASLDLLTRLRVKGFQLSIDDFGTGYSSMLQLVRLPFSEIKVDKSFVMTATRSEESRTVIRSIVELGHSLGLRSTAEGVEDAETLAYLKQVGCDLAQGYHIARPMAGDRILKWMQER